MDMAARDLQWNKTLPLLWNSAGLYALAVVVAVLVSHAYETGLWHLHESILTHDFGRFPFTLLAAFLMPVAVFMHLLSIVRISQLCKAPK